MKDPYSTSYFINEEIQKQMPEEVPAFVQCTVEEGIIRQWMRFRRWWKLKKGKIYLFFYKGKTAF